MNVIYVLSILLCAVSFSQVEDNCFPCPLSCFVSVAITSLDIGGLELAKICFCCIQIACREAMGCSSRLTWSAGDVWIALRVLCFSITDALLLESEFFTCALLTCLF